MDPFTLAAIAFVVWALYKSNPSEDQASAAFTFDDGAGYGGVPDMKNPEFRVRVRRGTTIPAT